MSDIPTIIDAEHMPPQPWRNGGGQTRELLAWPAGSDWQVRVSRADIAADGPFSAFPDVQRWLVVLEGAGVALHFVDGQKLLHRGDPPFEFDGANAPLCTLLDGPTQDLNLMVRKGQGRMQAVTAGKSWTTAHAVSRTNALTAQGLYTSVAGVWSNGGTSLVLAAHTLLWNHVDNAELWTFTPETHARQTQAWWIAFTPDTP